VAGSVPDGPRSIAVLVLEEGEIFGLRIPEFEIELYGPDLFDLIQRAEEYLWRGLEGSGQPVPGATTLAIERVTKDEFGPTCYERRAEELDRLEDE
jgi:hypothetical protein